MEHEGWRPDWLMTDLEPQAPLGATSSFEVSRALEFAFGEPATECSVSIEPIRVRSDGEHGIFANQWASDAPTLAPEAFQRSKPQGIKRPEIPGYEIHGELGRGAMGVVYRAHQIRLNREVALKMILAGDHASADTLARFTTEAETIAKLKHPHIVQIYNISDWEGRPFVELEYVEGGSLASRLDGTPWPPRAAARLMESLARAAAEAHRLGIVHRDLKPANILMTNAGEPKISDFGLAKSLEENSGLTRTESILGSPNYMAPEQAEGRAKDVGPAADIYALGANLYELLTGRPPFVAPTILATLDLVKNAEPVPPRRLQPLIDQDLETICLKCLEKQPQKRYDTADALADDIAAYLAREPIKARRSPHWERVARWIRRRPSTAALILVSVLAVIAVGGVIQWRRAEVERLDAASRENAEVLKEQVDRFVLLGREAMKRGEWETSRNQLSTALALIRSEPRLSRIRDVVQSSLDQCLAKLAEQRRRESARERYARFLKLYDESVFYQSDYTGLDAEANIRASRASASQALALFGKDPVAKGSAEERKGLEVVPEYFDARELERIRGSCYELALLLAESTSQPLPGEDPASQNRKALEILETVRDDGEITPAFHLGRAAALERSGDKAAADRERRRASEVPAEGWSAVDHFLTGEQAYRRKDLKRAIESFRHALALQPERFWAQYFLAVCLLKEHRPAEAHSALIACQSRRPMFTWTYLLKGFAEGEMREFDLAEQDFRRASELRLNDQERYVMLVNRGVMRIRRGRHDAAAADLSEAIQLKPDQFEAYINLSMAYKNLGQWDNALATLDRAIKGHPREAVLYRARSQVYRLRSMTDQALADLRKVIELTPPRDPAIVADLSDIGLILQQTGRPEESLAVCDQALQIRPDWHEIQRIRGVDLMMLRRYEEAILSFDVCLARGERSAALFEARGLALSSSGAYDRALADYTMALSLGPPTTSLLANRGWVYLLSGAPSLAQRDFDHALRLDSTNGHAYSGRALTHVQTRKIAEAIDDARESLRLSPDDSRQIYNAARVYCQAAAYLEGTPERSERTLASADRYRNESIRLLARALELCPEADRTRFWNECVKKDSTLDLIRRSRSFLALGARATSARRSGDSRPERVEP
jgi:tetratricopeptide (TPR) repeat protein